MNTEIVSIEPSAVRAWSEGRRIWIELSDERILSFPASRFRRLRDASNEQLARVEIEVEGFALRWEEIDEDITVPGVVAGHFELPPVPTA